MENDETVQSTEDVEELNENKVETQEMQTQTDADPSVEENSDTVKDNEPVEQNEVENKKEDKSEKQPVQTFEKQENKSNSSNNETAAIVSEAQTQVAQQKNVITELETAIKREVNARKVFQLVYYTSV